MFSNPVAQKWHVYLREGVVELSHPSGGQAGAMKLDPRKRKRFWEIAAEWQILLLKESNATESGNVDCLTIGVSTHRTTSYSNNR